MSPLVLPHLKGRGRAGVHTAVVPVDPGDHFRILLATISMFNSSLPVFGRAL